MLPVPSALIRSIAGRCIVLLGIAYTGRSYLLPGGHYTASCGNVLMALTLSDASEFDLVIWKAIEPVFEANWVAGQTMRVRISERMDWVAWLEATEA